MMETVWTITELVARMVVLTMLLGALYFWISPDDWDDGA
jgi:hypothetical protein